MSTITVTEKAAKFIEDLMENAETEKAIIADAFTAATESMTCHVDEEDYRNICNVLSRYCRLISLIS